MSRVRKPGGKYMNENRYDSSMYGPSKMVRIHHEGEDYHKATTLSQWLFAKYDMSYKTFRNKSKNRRDELRQEYEFDTGVKVAAREHMADLSEEEKARFIHDISGTPAASSDKPL